MADENTSVSTEQQPETTTTTDTTQQAQQTPSAPVQSPAPNQASSDDDESFVRMPKAAFNERLASSRSAAERAVFEELGLTRDEIAALREEKRQREDAQKTLEQRVAERDAELKAAQQERDSYLATIKDRAGTEMELLTEQQREAVKKLAGERPAEQLKAIDALWPTWKQAATAQAEPRPAASQEPPPQAQTSPAPSAPGGGAPPGEVDHRAKYEDLEKNPFLRARYGALHANSVYRPRN